MEKFTLQSHDGKNRDDQNATSLDELISEMLNCWWEEEYEAGFTVLVGKMAVATLTTFHFEGSQAGMVSVSRFDGLLPSHEIYHVAYRFREADGEERYERTDVRQLTTDEALAVA
jgi:hypothetical protein